MSQGRSGGGGGGGSGSPPPPPPFLAPSKLVETPPPPFEFKNSTGSWFRGKKGQVGGLEFEMEEGGTCKSIFKVRKYVMS